jgi:4-hydroxyproline epimerase
MYLTQKKIFNCIDAHTCGNPVRVISEGGPDLKGADMSEKRQHFLKEFDWIRTGLMFEPRGHDMMSGAILYPPSDPLNDCGILFIETSGCLPMCGHGTIGTITVAIEERLFRPKTKGKVRLETPAGLVLVDYRQKGNKVCSVKLQNVPSFLAASNLPVYCEGLGPLRADVAYGGNYYAIIDPQKNFSGLQNFTAGQLVAFSRTIRNKLNHKHAFVHPNDPSINGLSHVLWTGDTLSSKATARNAVFYGNKAIDRSPCGTGTSARMAQWHAKGLLKKGEDFIHESIIGSQFTGRIEQECIINGMPAIVPSIEGQAWITGYNKLILDEADPYVEGFSVI